MKIMQEQRLGELSSDGARRDGGIMPRLIQRAKVIIGTIALMLLFLMFSWAHLTHFLDTGSPMGLALAAQETVLVVLYLVRRVPRDESTRVGDWMVAGIGTALPLLYRPTGGSVLGLSPVWIAIELAGVLLTVYASLKLGRSFGIVAANRGVKRAGPYTLVRHPIYASYIIRDLGYILESPSAANLVVFAVLLVFQLMRIRAEESVLARDPSYREYLTKTRFRLVPFLY